MSATSKIIWSSVLLCVFMAILVTGRTNIRNFEKVQSSIEEIYRDRLVVKGLIFDLASLLHQKEVAILSKDKVFFSRINDSVNTKISDLLRDFRATKLTMDEEGTLKRFSKSIAALKTSEKDFGLANDPKLNEVQVKRFIGQIKDLEEDLKTLSTIQLTEGKRKLITSDQAVDSMHTFARAENILLLVFGALILLIIFVVPGPDGSLVFSKNKSLKEGDGISREA